MVFRIIFTCFIIGSLIGLSILVVHIFRSSRLKMWQKLLYSFFATGVRLAFISFILVVFAGMGLYAAMYALSDHELPKDPKQASLFLKNVGVGIAFPNFKVDEHCLKYIGGDDTEEYWEITFLEPLSPEFLSKLDSLCHVDSARWHHYDKYVGHDAASDSISCYEYVDWNSELIELHETVTIFPGQNRAKLSRVKI